MARRINLMGKNPESPEISGSAGDIIYRLASLGLSFRLNDIRRKLSIYLDLCITQRERDMRFFFAPICVHIGERSVLYISIRSLLFPLFDAFPFSCLIET